MKDGRAVAVAAVRAHPVNRGKLCPKGLSEHYIIDAENRAKYPLLRKNGKLVRVGWDEALDVMVERFRATQAKYGAESLGRAEHRPAGHRRVLHARQAGAARLRHQQLRRQHDAVHGQRRLRLQAFLRQRRPSRRLRGSGDGRCDSADRRQHRRQPSDPLPVSGGESQQDADRGRSARHEDGDDGGPSSAAQAALRPGAAQRHRPHSDPRRPDRSRLHRRSTPPDSRSWSGSSKRTRRSASPRSPA